MSDKTGEMVQRFRKVMQNAVAEVRHALDEAGLSVEIELEERDEPSPEMRERMAEMGDPVSVCGLHIVAHIDHLSEADRRRAAHIMQTVFNGALQRTFQPPTVH